MKAQVGDHIVITAPSTGGAVRDGEIIEVRGTDGAPPYLVRWTDSRNEALFYPGSDAHVTGSVEPVPAPAALQLRHVRSWRVDIDLFESDDETNAHAVLVSEAPHHLDANGSSRRNPLDVAKAEIGAEYAVGRALHRLADRLLATAAADVEELGVHHRYA